MKPAPAVMLFVRSPELGKVKTRLARTLGDEPALAAYHQLVAHALLRFAPLVRARCVREVCYAGERNAALETWASTFRARLLPQDGADLGQRMHNALFRHTSLGRRAVIVGADVPSLDAAVVEQAWTALNRQRAVIAPCEDGGYGLIGLARPFAGLFEGVSWGTGKVLRQTMQQAARVGEQPHLLQLQWDVDDAEDWGRFRSAKW